MAGVEKHQGNEVEHLVSKGDFASQGRRQRAGL